MNRDGRLTHTTAGVDAMWAYLALGKGLEDAILGAIQYLRAGLERGLFPGRGFGIPNHFPPEPWAT